MSGGPSGILYKKDPQFRQYFFHVALRVLDLEYFTFREDPQLRQNFFQVDSEGPWGLRQGPSVRQYFFTEGPHIYDLGDKG
jgi:hypothetical protein